jgi:hypothetical protein
MTQGLLLATRGGLGDHIISNGLIHHLRSEVYDHREVHIVCYPQWEIPLTYLYEDADNVILHPGEQIALLGVSHEQHLQKLAAKLDLKYYSVATTNVDLRKYQEYFYKSVGHPFEYRYNKFQLPKRELYNEEFINTIKPKNPYALCFFWDKFTNGTVKHIQKDKISSGLDIVEITPKKTSNIFEWLPIIYDAEEIHCVPGGPFHLIDSVLDKCKAQKFFYHDARRETCMNPNNVYNNNCWEFVGYSVKHAL